MEKEVKFRSNKKLLQTFAYLVKTQKESDADIIPGMIHRDFALFGTMRSVYVNEEPDRNNPYLAQISS